MPKDILMNGASPLKPHQGPSARQPKKYFIECMDIGFDKMQVYL